MKQVDKKSIFEDIASGFSADNSTGETTVTVTLSDEAEPVTINAGSVLATKGGVVTFRKVHSKDEEGNVISIIVADEDDLEYEIQMHRVKSVLIKK